MSAGAIKIRAHGVTGLLGVPSLINYDGNTMLSHGVALSNVSC